VDTESLKGYLKYEISLDELYAVDDRYDFLRQRDAIFIENSAKSPQEPDRALEVRHIYNGPLIDYLNDHPERYHIQQAARRQIGREVADNERLTILEVIPTWVSERD
jgi:hypothetical protein